jgi:hypothetical protein
MSYVVTRANVRKSTYITQVHEFDEHIIITVNADVSIKSVISRAIM